MYEKRMWFKSFKSIEHGRFIKREVASLFENQFGTIFHRKQRFRALSFLIEKTYGQSIFDPENCRWLQSFKGKSIQNTAPKVRRCRGGLYRHSYARNERNETVIWGKAAAACAIE